MHLSGKTDKSRTIIIYFNQRIRREADGYIVGSTLIPGDLVAIARTDDNGDGYYSSLILQSDAVIDRELIVATNTKEECIRVRYRGRPNYSNCNGWTWTLIPIKIIDKIEITETNITTLTIEHGLSWEYVKKEHEQHGERGPVDFESCETEHCPTYRTQIKRGKQSSSEVHCFGVN